MPFDLIDAAEASGLSRVPIRPEKGKGKAGRFGSSAREWYSGWSCMKTLISKRLVIKSSCPAKYMLTQEGQEAARECLMRSIKSKYGIDSNGWDTKQIVKVSCRNPWREISKGFSVGNGEKIRFWEDLWLKEGILKDLFPSLSSLSRRKSKSDSLFLVFLFDRGFFLLIINTMFLFPKKKSMENPIEKTANAKVLSVLDVDNISYQELAHRDSATEMILLSPTVSRWKKSFDIPRLYIVKSHPVPKSRSDDFKASSNVFSLPPLSFGETFEDAYEVILISDDREQFATRGQSRPGRIIENVRTQFKIKIERQPLPGSETETFVIILILRSCFTTEILEGFDVQRTIGLVDTLKKYVYLTEAITQYYKSEYSEEQRSHAGSCPCFGEVIKRSPR
ncbi:Restriction endonuclease, type II-like superfamily protein [Prunus dulcis]|uniref:Crossover junction endonuclease MUS81 n=1 Tax=Prunus dulcis TaxID=3755 RepID=A0A4Y1QZ11_PRUDU|nr:Restriction endonuclease, type II-like superfamily protein [Prunus dulcis]